MIEIYNWLYKIIQSSTNQFHLDASEVLIELFAAKFGEEAKNDLIILKQLKHDKWLEIHNVIH